MSVGGNVGPAEVDLRQWTTECTIKNSDQIFQLAESVENETFCMSQNDNFSNYSAMSQKDKLHIGLNLGRILHSVQILIVSKLTQKVIFYQMQNCARMYKSPEILIIFCTIAELN